MIKKGAILLGITALMFSSCIEHEVIPPPVPMVDLSCHFYGEINGAEVELVENVLSYTNIGTKDQIILAAPATDRLANIPCSSGMPTKKCSRGRDGNMAESSRSLLLFLSSRVVSPFIIISR